MVRKINVSKVDVVRAGGQPRVKLEDKDLVPEGEREKE